MVKLKYQFTTWAKCKYYFAISNGKTMDLNVIFSPKDRFGNQEIEIQARSKEMDGVLQDYSPFYSAGGFLQCLGKKECMKRLEEIAKRIA